MPGRQLPRDNRKSGHSPGYSRPAGQDAAIEIVDHATTLAECCSALFDKAAQTNVVMFWWETIGFPAQHLRAR